MVAILGGLIAVALGLIGLIKWWILFLKALQATVPAMLIVGGIIAIVVGVSSIKDKIKEKQEKSKTEEAKS